MQAVLRFIELNKTYMPKAKELDRKWYVIDLKGKTLGRAAAAIAHVLIGKHKPDYVPHMDTGDFVIAVNCDKVRVTGKKSSEKMYYRHSGYPGGIKEESFNSLLKRRPERIIELAVKNMLPKNRLGRQICKKLKAYKGPDHPHQAQMPMPFPENFIKRVKEAEE